MRNNDNGNKKKITSLHLLKKLTAEQQIQGHIKKGYKNRLSEIVGMWPGDESIEEILFDINS